MVDHEIIFQVCAKLLSVSCSLLLLYCQVQVLEATFVQSTTMIRTSDSRGMNLLFVLFPPLWLCLFTNNQLHSCNQWTLLDSDNIISGLNILALDIGSCELIIVIESRLISLQACTKYQTVSQDQFTPICK